MGRATRWLKGLFGLKTKETTNSGDRHNVDKSGRDSSGLCHNPTTIPPNIIPAEAAWLRSCYNETEKEQRKHAIAVAAATAAAADAAVAAVHAAVAVVRLTSHGRGTILDGGRTQWAAVKIQTVFKGYLARKALRALKGLVKLQAHVRGYLVRKQATATLHSMQALIRAQATVLSQRICSQNEKFMERSDDARTEHTVSIHNRRLWGSFDNFMSNFDENPKIVEVYTGRPNPRSRRTNTFVSDFSVDPPYQTYSSPVSSRDPARLAIPDWGLTGDECRFSTACSTRSPSPRFVNSVWSNTPGTPAKSMCADNFRQSLNFPNYMANTQSSKAKLRCHSAPKQRPDPAGSKKRLSLNEMMEGRNRLSGAKMQRSCSQVQEAISIKNAVMGKLTRSSELRRELEKNLG